MELRHRPRAFQLPGLPKRNKSINKQKKVGDAEDKTMDSFNTVTLGPHGGVDWLPLPILLVAK